MGLKSKLGNNKTGLEREDRKEAMTTGNEDLLPPASLDGALAIAEVRVNLARNQEGIGTMPPPSSVKQVGKAAKSLLAGGNPNVLIDKLSERLAFERSGTRLYEALLSKYDAYGAFAGGPSREEIVHIHHEELAHFRLVESCLVELGADPTAITPSADVVGVAGQGLAYVLADARSNLIQSLEAILIAELVDNDGWEMLIRVAKDAGQSAMARDFDKALRSEQEHLREVRKWLAAAHGQATKEAEEKPKREQPRP